MHATEIDLNWIQVTVVSEADLETVRREVCQALDAHLVVPILGDIDEYGPKGEALGFKLELVAARSNGRNRYTLYGSMDTASFSDETRTVSLSDFLCARLNASAISGWSVDEQDRPNLEQRFGWDDLAYGEGHLD